MTLNKSDFFFIIFSLQLTALSESNESLRDQLSFHRILLLVLTGVTVLAYLTLLWRTSGLATRQDCIGAVASPVEAVASEEQAGNEEL